MINFTSRLLGSLMALIISVNAESTLARIDYPKGSVRKFVISGKIVSVFEGQIDDLRSLKKVKAVTLLGKQESHIRKIVSKFDLSIFQPKGEEQFPASDGSLDGVVWYIELEGDGDVRKVLWETGGSTQTKEFFGYLVELTE